MLDSAGQQQTLKALTQSGILRQGRLLGQAELKPFVQREITAAVAGVATVGGKDMALAVGVNRRFPESLPIVFLSPWDALGFIPHVDEDGQVCYADGEGLVLDAEDPVGILVEATKRALDVLEDGVSGKNRRDFADEFRAYWLRVAKRSLQSFIMPTATMRRITAYRKTDGYAFVADSDRDVLGYSSGDRAVLKSLTQRRALYVPLQPGSFVMPPAPGRSWRTTDVRRIVQENLSQDNRRLLAKLGREWKTEELVVLGVPRDRGGMTLIGLLFTGVQGGHPLLVGAAKDPPEPFRVERRDASYLLPRGGGDVELSRFRVLVGGCGSVGGFVALALPQAGITHLTLVDPDTLQAENIFRHVLGRSALEQPKVHALKAEIDRKYPYVTVTPHQAHIGQAIADGLVSLADFDLAIFALGNPTVELEMSRLLHVDGARTIIVFAWLESYGIGGHALLTRAGARGCFRCLYTPVLDGDAPLHNRAAFAAPGQSFGKDEVGCGSLYTPYGALDARRTADLAVRLALDGLTGREPRNAVLSWKGPPDEFEAAGFQVSARHLLTPDQLLEQRYAYIAPGCPICARPRP